MRRDGLALNWEFESTESPTTPRFRSQHHLSCLASWLAKFPFCAFAEIFRSTPIPRKNTLLHTALTLKVCSWNLLLATVVSRTAPCRSGRCQRSSPDKRTEFTQKEVVLPNSLLRTEQSIVSTDSILEDREDLSGFPQHDPTYGTLLTESKGVLWFPTAVIGRPQVPLTKH